MPGPRRNRRKCAPHAPAWREIDLRTPALAATALAATVVAAGVGAKLLDRPITAVTVAGTFERVSAGQVEAALRSELRGGFLSVDLRALQKSIAGLAWVDRAKIQRRWPAGLGVTISEQIPAARWGQAGLLNIRGELFLEQARHIPAELPRLAGPQGSERRVAERYLMLRGALAGVGLHVRTLRLDARGAWDLELNTGIAVRLGREHADGRIARLVRIVAPLIRPRMREVAYVDMRYSNGFAVGWTSPRATQPARVPGMQGSLTDA